MRSCKAESLSSKLVIPKEKCVQQEDGVHAALWHGVPDTTLLYSTCHLSTTSSDMLHMSIQCSVTQANNLLVSHITCVHSFAHIAFLAFGLLRCLLRWNVVRSCPSMLNSHGCCLLALCNLLCLAAGTLFAKAIRLTWAIRTLWAKPQAMASHALLCQSEDICPESGLLLRRRTLPSEGKEHRGHQLPCTKACGGSAQRFPVGANQLICAAWVPQALGQPFKDGCGGLACADIPSS